MREDWFDKDIQNVVISEGCFIFSGLVSMMEVNQSIHSFDWYLFQLWIFSLFTFIREVTYSPIVSIRKFTQMNRQAQSRRIRVPLLI